MPPSPSTIQFKNGHQAQAVTQEPGDSAAALVELSVSKRAGV